MRKWILAAGAAVLSFSLVACGTGTKGSEAASQNSGQESVAASQSVQSKTADGPFSAFTTTDLAGNAIDQSVLQNAKITMVNVWATFCSPCISEMPDLGALHAAYADKDVQVIGIVSDLLDQFGVEIPSQVELAQELVEKTGADYLHLRPSPDLTTYALREVSVVPTTFFVDAQGNLLADPYMGSRSQEDWSKIIDSLLEVAQ